MKKHGKTDVPRKQQLNKALVELGCKTHKDKHRKKWEQESKFDKREREWDDA